MKHGIMAAVLFFGLCGCISWGYEDDEYDTRLDITEPCIATFSIVAYDENTGDLGVAVQSKFFGVGSVVPYAKAGIGAVASQAFGNTTYGPRGLFLLQAGKTPDEVVKILTGSDDGREFRQLGVVDAKGRSASYTGDKAQEWRGHVVGKNYACQGNILAGEDVVKAMAAAFENSADMPFPERLVAALKAAQEKGGDKRGMQSAALLVVREGGGYAGFNDRYIDLRVDDNPAPIEELARLLKLHRETWGTVPVPAKERGKVVKEKREPGNPHDVFMKTLELNLAKDWKGMYDLCRPEYRAKVPFDKFSADQEKIYEQSKSAIEVIKYFETEYLSETEALLFYRHKAAARPYPQKMVKIDGKWLLEDF
jgi:uncharacterized Ntn-hydrolase superfamily protein